MAGSGTTILETPPYVIALVFTFFLVVTLSFEKTLHVVRHALEKRGKHGLVAAMNNMMNELMCLGVATLILLLFQSEIVSYCMNAKNYSMTWLDHVRGCSCCLTRTTGVSACYLAAKGCVSGDTLSDCCAATDQGAAPKVCTDIFDLSTDWVTSNSTASYSVEVPVDVTSNKRRLMGGGGGDTTEVDCYGRVQTNWPECGFRPYYRPAIGANALHQIHLFIFIIAVSHIIMGILLVSVASLRLRFLRRWKEDGDEYLMMAHKATHDFNLAFQSADGASKLESQSELHGQAELEEESSRDAGSMHPANLPDTIEVPRMNQWSGRHGYKMGFWRWWKEMLVCVFRQLNPVTLSKEEFCLMRASFVLTHGITSDSDFSFQDYLRNVLEDDFSKIVGLGLPMWIFIILFVLLSSSIGWCIWVFVIISGAILITVNGKLVWIIRYVTRGGNVHRLKPGVFWGNKPGLLLPVIKFLLFFVSYVYANAIFFATQFGTKSCFFSRNGFQGQPVPWWIIMVINTSFLISLSLFTLPLFSITVQMGGECREAFLSEAVATVARRTRVVVGAKKQGIRTLLGSIIAQDKIKDESRARVFTGERSDAKGA